MPIVGSQISPDGFGQRPGSAASLASPLNMIAEFPARSAAGSAITIRRLVGSVAERMGR